MPGILRRLVERRRGTHTVSEPRLPHGQDVVADLRRRAPDLAVSIIFDAGANEGQSALRFAKAFPGTRIVSFETLAAASRRSSTRLSTPTRHSTMRRCCLFS